MSQPPRQTGSMGDELTNAAMVGLLALVALTFILRGAGSVTAWITSSAQPSGGPASGVSVLLNPSDPATALGAPGLSPVVYWIITGLISSNPRSDSSWHVADTSLCFESYAGRPGPRRSSTIAATPHSAMPQAVGHFHTN